MRHAVYKIFIILIIGITKISIVNANDFSVFVTEGWQIQSSLEINYSDNILRYSKKYKDVFVNSLQPERYRIDSYDDAIFAVGLKIDKILPFHKKYWSRISASVFYDKYFLNGIKDMYSIDISLKQKLPEKFSVKFNYYYLPHYYARHYREGEVDGVVGGFTPFEYAKELFGGEIQKSFRTKTTVKGDFDFSRYFHNKYYVEYDNETIGAGISISQRIFDLLRIKVGYKYARSKKNALPDDLTNEHMINTDASYFQNRVIIGANIYMPELLKHENRFFLKIDFSRRMYTSQVKAGDDPIHAGRIEDYWIGSCSYSYFITSFLRAQIIYNLRVRELQAWEKKDLNILKNYTQNTVGLKFTGTLKIN